MSRAWPSDECRVLKKTKKRERDFKNTTDKNNEMEQDNQKLLDKEKNLYTYPIEIKTPNQGNKPSSRWSRRTW